MVKLILADNTELEVIQIDGLSVYAQGASRDALQIHFEKGKYSFDDLDAMFSDESKTAHLKINTGTTVDEAGVETVHEYAHDNYRIKHSIELKKVILQPQTTESEEVSEERIVVTVAQLTYAEKHLADQQETIDTILISMVEE